MGNFRVTVDGPADAAHVRTLDKGGFDLWDQRVADRTGYMIGRNNFFSQNQVQWGHKSGINTGNGQLEGSMSAELFLTLGETRFKDNPNWFTDDKLFYKFLREFPWHDARPGKHHSRGEKFGGKGA